jgi:hypothetical protein
MPYYPPPLSLPLGTQNVNATGTITTTSTTPVLATGMTITPVAGTYLVIFGSACYQSTTGSGCYVEASIYAGGSQCAESLRQVADGPAYQTPFTAVAVATVDGTQAIEGRWKMTTGSGTASMLGTRSLTIVKIG